MSATWLQYNDANTNLLKQTYMKNFVDISGNVYVRNGGIKITAGNVVTTGNVNCNNTSVTSTTISTQVQNALNAKMGIVGNSAVTGVTITGVTVNYSQPSASNLPSTISITKVLGNTTLNVSENLNSNNVNVLGSISINGTVTHSSDGRLKINKVPIMNSLDTLSRLKPLSYTKYVNASETIREDGFIAQDVWTDAPELRHLINVENPFNLGDGRYDEASLNFVGPYAGLNYTGLIPFIVKGLQELDEMVDKNISDLSTI
jgi:hypothetical protein